MSSDVTLSKIDENILSNDERKILDMVIADNCQKSYTTGHIWKCLKKWTFVDIIITAFGINTIELNSRWFVLQLRHMPKDNSRMYGVSEWRKNEKRRIQAVYSGREGNN